MPTLTIKNLPRELHQRLKESAAKHRRSMNNEAIVTLEKALKRDQPDEEALMRRIRELRAEFPASLSEVDRREAVEEGRA